MTWQPNIPVALAAADFEQKHADMLASARGEVAAVATTDTPQVYYIDFTPDGFNPWYELWEASRKAGVPAPATEDFRVINQSGGNDD